MKNVSTVIPCYAADTSGVCSALYELGGMTVVHDASGCNSTYSTHDEPRWYDRRSMIYISALTELDAVMGNDENLITDIVSAAKDQNPAFIALCGSPMPMMTGFDYRAVAEDIQGRTGIPTFGIETNGTHSYIDGASKAFLALVKEFVHDMPKAEGIGVNILGATPLDFGLNGSIESIKKWLTAEGFGVVSCIAMDSSLEEIKRAASAKVNLVVSWCGIEAAEYMQDKFGINYVIGVPIGNKFADNISVHIAELGYNYLDYTDKKYFENGVAANVRNTLTKSSCPETVVIGECIGAGSLAAAIELDLGISTGVITHHEVDEELMLCSKDAYLLAEEDIKAYLAQNNVKCVVADPLYKYVLPEGCRLIELPHFAFSGRCFAKRIPNLINSDIKEFFK